MNRGQLTNPREYRRGMVFGLTLAETLILLTFLLLLTTSAMTLQADRRAAHTAVELHRAEAAIAPLAHELGRAGHRILDPHALVSLLERARREPALVRKVSDLHAKMHALEEQEAVARQRAASLLAEVNRLGSAQNGAVAKAAQRDRLVAILDHSEFASSSQTLPPTAILRRVIGRASELAATNATLGGQNAQMRRAFRHLRGGSGLPYCWPTSAGNPEFMFVLRIRDGKIPGTSSVVISDFDPKPRPNAPEWDLLRNVPLGKPVPTSDFIADTGSLRARAKADKCLYAMEAIDQTGPTSKAAYKNFWGQVGPPRFSVHETSGR